MARYSVGLWAGRFESGIAWGTFVVNVAGCFLLAVILTLVQDTQWVSPELKLLLATGFMGSLTTFSTFGYETWAFAERGQWGLAGANLGANLLLGLVAVVAGVSLVRALLPTA